MKKQTYFFCGIGGIGMNALAQIVLAQGHHVAGSDRAYDMGIEQEKFGTLTHLGVKLYPQDGSGVTAEKPDFFVVSTAVEATIPDVKVAKDGGIKIIHRSDVLTNLTRARGNLMTVGGTSGKSTTAAMLAHIMTDANYDPLVINGAGVVGQKNKGVSYARAGNGETAVIEVDESDNSIAKSVPNIAILNNIALDHKSISELQTLFGHYLDSAKTGVVINHDCPNSMHIKPENKKVVTFSLKNPEADVYATNVHAHSDGISFSLNGAETIKLSVFGWFNVANALAAIAAAFMAGVPMVAAAKSLESFQGTKRRLERVGAENGVLVLDDFAHNPHKIAASIKALKEYPGRLFVLYQPHGFASTKHQYADLVQAFSQNLANQDTLIMMDIYYVGGTADKSVSSADLIRDIREQGGVHALHIPKREGIAAVLLPQLKEGDRICVMGARDNTLSDFAQQLLGALKLKSA